MKRECPVCKGAGIIIDDEHPIAHAPGRPSKEIIQKGYTCCLCKGFKKISENKYLHYISMKKEIEKYDNP